MFVPSSAMVVYDALISSSVLSRIVTPLTVTAAYVNVWPTNAGANAYVVILSPVLLRVGTAPTVIATSAFGHKYYIIF